MEKQYSFIIGKTRENKSNNKKLEWANGCQINMKKKIHQGLAIRESDFKVLQNKTKVWNATRFSNIRERNSLKNI